MTERERRGKIGEETVRQWIDTALSISGLPVLIYSEPAADITASVLKELNAGHRTSPAK